MTSAQLREAPTRERVRCLAARLPVALALSILGVMGVGVRPLAFGVVAVALVTEELVRADIAEHRLPNRLVLPLYPLVLLSLVADWAATGSDPLMGLGSGAVWFVFLLLLCLAGGMGMGDVKLGGALGLCLGVVGAVPAILGLVLAFVTGAIGGMVVLLRPTAGSAVPGPSRRIPFGPFLLAGFWATIVCFPLLDGATA